MKSVTSKSVVRESEDTSNKGSRIFDLLRERILNWSYPPGRHLGEIALCAEFKASRIPVREALRALTEQGLVDKIPNQGCYVKQPDVTETQQLYDMRLALELFVVESLANQNFDRSEWFAQERKTWESFLSVKADDLADRDILVNSDTNFHLGLADELGNEQISTALKEINERLRFVRLATITNAHRIQGTAGEHLAILDALEANDSEEARRRIRQNINHSRNKVEIAIARALMNAHERSGP